MECPEEFPQDSALVGVRHGTQKLGRRIVDTGHVGRGVAVAIGRTDGTGNRVALNPTRPVREAIALDGQEVGRSPERLWDGALELIVLELNSGVGVPIVGQDSGQGIAREIQFGQKGRQGSLQSALQSIHVVTALQP